MENYDLQADLEVCQKFMDVLVEQYLEQEYFRDLLRQRVIQTDIGDDVVPGPLSNISALVSLHVKQH